MLIKPESIELASWQLNETTWEREKGRIVSLVDTDIDQEIDVLISECDKLNSEKKAGRDVSESFALLKCKVEWVKERVNSTLLHNKREHEANVKEAYEMERQIKKAQIVGTHGHFQEDELVHAIKRLKLTHRECDAESESNTITDHHYTLKTMFEFVSSSTATIDICILLHSEFYERNKCTFDSNMKKMCKHYDARACVLTCDSYDNFKSSAFFTHMRRLQRNRSRHSFERSWIAF